MKRGFSIRASHRPRARSNGRLAEEIVARILARRVLSDATSQASSQIEADQEGLGPSAAGRAVAGAPRASAGGPILIKTTSPAVRDHHATQTEWWQATALRGDSGKDAVQAEPTGGKRKSK